MATALHLEVKDILNVVVLIGGKEFKDIFSIVSVEVTKEINRVSKAVICIEDINDGTKEFNLSQGADLVPGKEIIIKSGYGTKNKPIFNGIIVEQGVQITPFSRPMVVIRCKSVTSKLTIGRRSRSFDKAKDSDVLKKIFKEHGVTAKAEATTVTYPKLVQYAATDWDFVLARAEANGMVIVDEDGKPSIEKPKVTGAATVSVTYGQSLFEMDARVNAHYQIDKMTAFGWDPSKQAMTKVNSSPPTASPQGNLASSKLKSVMSTPPAELRVSTPLIQGDLQNWANASLQRAHLSRINGYIKCYGTDKIKTGTVIELAGVGARLNGKAYVTGVTHNIEQGTWRTTAYFGLSPFSHTEEKHDYGARPAGGLLPPIHGLHCGVVKQIHEDPDGETRILVTLPNADPEGKGIWARVSDLYATKEAGFFFWPEINDEVLLGFLDNDPRYPVILGSLYGKKHAPPYPPDKKNNIKAIVTNSKMKIEFNDEKKIVTILTPGGNSITMDDDKKSIVMVDSNKNNVTMDDKGVSITTNKDIKFTAKGKVTIDGTGGVVLTSKGDVKADGTNVEVAAKANFKAKGVMVNVEGSGPTTVKGAVVKVEASGPAIVKGALVLIN